MRLGGFLRFGIAKCLRHIDLIFPDIRHGKILEEVVNVKRVLIM